jgi:hypothetical protein
MYVPHISNDCGFTRRPRIADRRSRFRSSPIGRGRGARRPATDRRAHPPTARTGRLHRHTRHPTHHLGEEARTCAPIWARLGDVLVVYFWLNACVPGLRKKETDGDPLATHRHACPCGGRATLAARGDARHTCVYSYIRICHTPMLPAVGQARGERVRARTLTRVCVRHPRSGHGSDAATRGGAGMRRRRRCCMNQHAAARTPRSARAVPARTAERH